MRKKIPLLFFFIYLNNYKFIPYLYIYYDIYVIIVTNINSLYNKKMLRGNIAGGTKCRKLFFLE